MLVNSQLHEVLDRVTVLTSALEKAGVEVPPETAQPPAGGGAFSLDGVERIRLYG